jgi:bifunctional non-homologous end joining protein LigD
LNVTVEADGHVLTLTNLEKVLWPEDNLTKAHLIDYYRSISPFLLPHLEGRPFVMSRYPDGIYGEHFYQKNRPDYTPGWIDIFPVASASSGRTINYTVCNNLATLLWLVNQVCIEMHPWMSKTGSPAYPDIAVFDLDPMPPLGFREAAEISLLVRDALAGFGITGYPKISGATGMHVFVPVEPKYTYEQVRLFVRFIFGLVHRADPDRTTFERQVENRGARVYLDYLQNSQGKTMAWQYSLRPARGAPVSTPLTWEEAETIPDPLSFNIHTVPGRLREKGDLMADTLTRKHSIDQVLEYAAASRALV